MVTPWNNKAIRDGRPRPPRHQVGWDIPLHFDTNPESLRPFVPEIWPNNVFNLSATYDLDLWPKILKIFVSHGVPIRNMYAKFHNDRLRNGWDITLWNFAKTRTNTQTHTQTDMGITIPRPPPMGGEVIQYLALPLWARGNNEIVMYTYCCNFNTRPPIWYIPNFLNFTTKSSNICQVDKCKPKCQQEVWWPAKHTSERPA